MENTPQFQSALEKRQLMLMKEFEQKLQDFDIQVIDAIVSSVDLDPSYIFTLTTILKRFIPVI